MYNRIRKSVEEKVKDKSEYKISYVGENGKRRYSSTEGTDGIDTYSTEIKITQLREDYFDPEENGTYDDDITCLPDGYLATALAENVFDVDQKMLDFKNGKVKVDLFEERDFHIDKYIQVDRSKPIPKISGIILDLKYDEEFVKAYQEGLTIEMPKAEEYYRMSQQNYEEYDDNDEVNFIDELEKIEEFVIEKLGNGAEAIVQGMYVIIKNNIFYIPAEEYYDLYEICSGQRKMYNMYETPGLYQTKTKLIIDDIQALHTMKEAIKFINKTKRNRNSVTFKYLDYFGKPENIVTKLLTDDKELYDVLKYELKEKQKQK